MRKYLLGIILLSFIIDVSGQDAHYSLFMMSPMRLNPANVGNFGYDFLDKDLRVSSHYRDQWRAVRSPYVNFQTPFITTSLGLDGQLKRHKVARGDFIGWGLDVMLDRSGDLTLTDVKPAGYLSVNKKINSYGNTYLTLGVGYGYTFRRIDYTKGVFDNQWTGTEFDPNRPTGETFTQDQVSFDDWHAGILFRSMPAKQNKLTLGYSMHHLNQPNVAFNDGAASQLSIAHVAHFNSEVKLDDRNSLAPQAFFQWQGKVREFTGLLYYKYRDEQQYKSEKFYQIGVGFRTVGHFEDIVNSDALYLAGQYRIDNLVVSAAYDINVSRLNVATNSRGAIEFNITYYFDLYRKIKKERRHHRDYRPICPKPQR